MEKKNVITKKVKYIDLPKPLKLEIGRKYGCSHETVCRALRMEVDTPLSAEIRRTALEMGGVFATKVKFIAY